MEKSLKYTRKYLQIFHNRDTFSNFFFGKRLIKLAKHLENYDRQLDKITWFLLWIPFSILIVRSSWHRFIIQANIFNRSNETNPSFLSTYACPHIFTFIYDIYSIHHIRTKLVRLVDSKEYWSAMYSVVRILKS